MRFEWDEGKRVANLAKHGVDFPAAEQFAFEDAIVEPDDRRDYGEAREIAIGRIGDRLHVLVYTRRGEAIRIIGLRKANAREVKRYEKSKT